MQNHLYKSISLNSQIPDRAWNWFSVFASSNSSITMFSFGLVCAYQDFLGSVTSVNTSNIQYISSLRSRLRLSNAGLLVLTMLLESFAAWRKFGWFEISRCRTPPGFPLWHPRGFYLVCVWFSSEDTCNCYWVSCFTVVIYCQVKLQISFRASLDVLSNFLFSCLHSTWR